MNWIANLLIKGKEPKASYRLRKLDGMAIDTSGEYLTLFAISRNESVHLPHFIDYYKALGIEKFIFVDNGPTDNPAARWFYLRASARRVPLGSTL
jgi:hypothetical protein